MTTNQIAVVMWQFNQSSAPGARSLPTRVLHHTVRPCVCRFYKVNMPSNTKTRTRRDRGGDEIAEVTHIIIYYIHARLRNYLIFVLWQDVNDTVNEIPFAHGKSTTVTRRSLPSISSNIWPTRLVLYSCMHAHALTNVDEHFHLEMIVNINIIIHVILSRKGV